MKKVFAFSLISVLTFSMLVACSDQPEQQSQTTLNQQPVQPAPVQTQPQVVVVENDEDDGLSAGEAMLVGAAAGALAGNLTSNTRDVHHYHNSSSTKYISTPSVTYKKPTDRAVLPATSKLSSVTKSSNVISSKSTTSSSKPISFNLNKPSSSSSSKSFKSSGSGFKSSSSRRR